MPNTFVHLRVHSSYSLLEGAMVVPKIVKKCVDENMPAIAITDSGNLFGALEFSMSASKAGVQPIIGCILKLDPGEDYKAVGRQDNFDELLLIAKNNVGYQNLLKLASSSYLNNSKGNEHIKIAQLEELREGLIVLTSGVKGTVGRLILTNRKKEAESFLLKLNDIFKDHLYIELMRHGLEDENVIERKFIEFGLKNNIPFVATNDVYFLDAKMHRAHEILLCIADGKYIHSDDRRKSTPHHYFKSAEEMRKLFSDIPEAIENSIVIARRCSVKAEQREIAFPQYKTSRAQTAEEELRILAEEGLKSRLDKVYEHDDELRKKEEKVYWDRLNYELDIIIKMNFASYLLIVSDFVKWAKEKDIPVGPGRGSGVGSAVSWCLEITDPDPIKFGLLFERFLNPERISLPDFDIDFCQDRRDEVIAYVREKYGEQRVAHIITFGKLQARAVIRDVGRVLQLPYTKIDRIAKLVPFNAINPVTLSQAIEMEPELKRIQEQNESIANLLDISLKLEGLYRHASTHAAGVVIADQDLENLVPLYKDEKSGALVIQYSMKYAEAAGLIKFDFLGLRTLTVISNNEHLLKETNKNFNLDNIKFNDRKTFEMLSKGLSMGVFQFDSGRMQIALSQMKPDSIEDVIALGALNRPGPMNRITDYIECKNGRASPDYLHPKLEKILKKTFGVLIYQEQVIETAQALAGYTVAAGDILRKAMGKKIKAEMDEQREIFIKGCVDREIAKEQADYIFDLIGKFAGYGFNRSHAVAYGIISYYTAYLKANYTAEFLVSIMNTELNDTDKINLFIQEAKTFEIPLIAPDINRSEPEFCVQEENGSKAIVYGLGAIRNISLQAMEELTNERGKNGPYKNIFDFIERADAKVINKRQLEYLIKAGAFDSVCSNRKQLFDSIDVLINYYNLKISSDATSFQMDLFSKEAMKDEPALIETKDWDNDVKLNFECDSFGFYMLNHPLDIYKEYFEKANIFGTYHIKNKLAQGTYQLRIAAIPITIKAKLSTKGRFMIVVMSTISGIVNVAIFDEELLEKSRDLIYSKVPLILDVTVMKEGEVERVFVKDVHDLKNYMNMHKPSITMTIKTTKGMAYVKTLLEVCEDKSKGSFAKIILNVEKDNKKVKIELPENTVCNLSKVSPKKLRKESVSIETSLT
jgi:DNA polymerase III subunit alpha